MSGRIKTAGAAATDGTQEEASTSGQDRSTQDFVLQPSPPIAAVAADESMLDVDNLEGRCAACKEAHWSKIKCRVTLRHAAPAYVSLVERNRATATSDQDRTTSDQDPSTLAQDPLRVHWRQRVWDRANKRWRYCALVAGAGTGQNRGALAAAAKIRKKPKRLTAKKGERSKEGRRRKVAERSPPRQDSSMRRQLLPRKKLTAGGASPQAPM